jgi:hypothetical protein
MFDWGIPADRKKSSGLRNNDGWRFRSAGEFSNDVSALDKVGEPRASAARLAD